MIANRHIRGVADDTNLPPREKPERISKTWIYRSLYIAAFCVIIANFANYFGSPLLTATVHDLGISLKRLSATLSLIGYSSQDISLLSGNINTTVKPNPTVKLPARVVTNKQPAYESLARIVELSGVKIGTQVPR